MVVVAPDKFKGTFSAVQICQLVEERLRRSGFTDEIALRPMADGGEGMSDVIMPGSAKVANGIYEKDGNRLIVSSEIIGRDAFAESGLPLMKRSSIALGQAVDPAYPTMIAVGGTATSDCGAGFLQGLGARFYDSASRLIADPLTPDTLAAVKSADLSPLKKYRITGIIDVKANLTEGELTALHFARQKALLGENLEGLADALRHFHKIVGGCSPWDGAGGGLGYAIASVCGARCHSGAELAVKTIANDLDNACLIITGEGCVDRQTTAGGKLVDAVFKEGAKRNIPVLVLYGIAESTDLYPHMAQLESCWENCAKTLAKRETL